MKGMKASEENYNIAVGTTPSSSVLGHYPMLYSDNLTGLLL